MSLFFEISIFFLKFLIFVLIVAKIILKKKFCLFYL